VHLMEKLLLGLGLAALPALCGPISITNQWTTFGWSASAPTNAFGGLRGYTGTLGNCSRNDLCWRRTL
jgi:hypothetical protein